MTITMPGRFTLGAAVAVLALVGLFLAAVATSTGSVQGSEQVCEYDVILMEEVCTSSDGETTLSTTSTPTPEPTEETDLGRWMPVPDVLHDGSLRPTKVANVIPPIPPIKNFKYTISTATPKPRVRALRQIRDVQVQNDQGAQGQGAQIQQNSTTLISNNGRPLSQVIGIVSEQAQSFTTGSNTYGYRVTSVEMDVNPDSTQSNYSVSIRANSSGIPGSTTLGTLTKSGSLSPVNTWTLVSFPASGDGIDLAASSTYWVVASVNSNVRMETTNADGEDSGGAAGWSMGNSRLFNFPNWDPSNSDTGALKLAVKGYAKTSTTPPTTSPPATPRGERYFPSEDGGTPVHAKAYSEDRGILLEYFTAECTGLRSASSPYHDFSFFDADGHRLMARNGWKYVYVQNSQGDVTGTKAMTISECASNKLYQRQQLCSNYTTGQLAPNNKENVCPAARNW